MTPPATGSMRQGKAIALTKNKLKLAVVGGAAMLAVVTAGPAAANHDHYVVTPGTCVEDIARGQTAKSAGEGGYHTFHDNVHMGTPGTKAFANANNPVAVYKNGTGPGCPA